LVTDDWLVVKGSGGSIYSLGDASATKWAPTAQVASKQGSYLAHHFHDIAALEPERQKLMAEGQDPSKIVQQLPPFR
jgi:NADH:ubiquinone reductase (non-electrogenic)